MSEDEFKRMFPITSNQELAQQTGTSIRSVIRRARSLGLRKDKAYLQLLAREKFAQLPAPIGEQHPNWKGGKPWKRFKDERYKAWRKEVLTRDNYICQHCGRKCYPREKGLAAHHKQPYATHPELRYEVSNGLTLCRTCHMKLHGKEFTIEMVPCACGCGTMIPGKDRYGRERRYVNFHAPKVVFKEKPRPSRAREVGDALIPCACGCGEIISPIGAGGKLRRYLHGHASRNHEWTQPERNKLRDARKRDTHKRKRNEKGQFT